MMRSVVILFAAIIAFYWVIPTLLMAFGFEAVKERWLSQQRWDNFVQRMQQLDAQTADEEQADE